MGVGFGTLSCTETSTSVICMTSLACCGWLRLLACVSDFIEIPRRW